jgi:hypothetical protein
MSRRAAKVDANQGVFVETLERCGAKVRDTSKIGEGFPDLLVLWRGHLFLVEIKNPAEATREQAADSDHVGMLTPSQLKMREAWPVIVALTAAEAMSKMDAAIASLGAKAA